MKQILSILYIILGFLHAERASAQLVLDTLLTVEGEVSRSFYSENNKIHWFTHKVTNAAYHNRVIDSAGVGISMSTFDLPHQSSSFLFRQKVGTFYYTLVYKDSVAFYRSNNDSTLGNLVASHAMTESGYVVDFRQTTSDEILVLLNILPQMKPAVVRFIPSTATLSYHDLSSRNGYVVSEADVKSMVRISNTQLMLSCGGCKRYLNNGNWLPTAYADWAIYDNNFVFVQDSVPLYAPNPNFPFGTSMINGPQSISNTLTLPSGNLVFVGTRARAGTQNSIPYLAVWSPQLTRMQQVTFGDSTLHYVFPPFQSTSLIRGYDGFIYVFVRFMAGQFGTDPRGMLIAKFDTSLNIISQQTLVRPTQLFPTYSVKLTSNRSGVYLLTSDTASSNILRIRNSQGLGLGVQSAQPTLYSKLYPNPVSDGQLFWEGSSASTTFKWYNYQGKLMAQQSLESNFQHALDVQDLSPGLYVLHAFSPEGYPFAPQKVIVR